MKIFACVCCVLLFASCARPDPMNGFDDTLDGLLASYPDATVAVAVRDPAKGVSWDRLPDRTFHAASTMKVPVMIEIYRLAEQGRLSLDDRLPVVNSFHSIVDGSLFSIEDDSDDAIYKRLGETMSVSELVYQMITVSSNLATNLLIDTVRADSVQATMERLGTRHMQVLRGVEDLKAFDLGMSNTTTASDLALVMERLMEGGAVSPESDRAMREVLLSQQFGEMIPAGLPYDVQIAHKTGQITAIHHDAAIIYPPQQPAFVLVILIEGITDSKESAALGARIATAVYNRLRTSPEAPTP